VTPRECIVQLAPASMDVDAKLEIAIRLVVAPEDTVDTLIERAREMLEGFRKKGAVIE
jgi:hypothetical protein